MDKCYDKLEDELCEILGKFSEEGIKQAQDVEVVKNALSGVQKIKIIREMERFGSRDFGFSRDSYGRGDSYRRGSYDDGGSYRRGRSHDRGSYDDGGGYSGHTIKEKMQRLMEQASPEEREMLNRFIQQM